jgi:ribosomal protein S18 acetylase RimI-like enzyme
MQAEEIIIRSAQSKDLSILALLNKQIIKEDFGAIITSGYPNSPIAQNPVLLDEYLNTMHECYSDLFNEEENLLQNTNLRLLVAVDQQKPENILGFCFSHQEDVQVYIRLLLIDKNYRNKGVGGALLTQTIKSYNGITSCALRTFSHGNEGTRAFYEKYGFTSDKKAEPSRTRVTEHSDTLTFILYQKKI